MFCQRIQSRSPFSYTFTYLDAIDFCSNDIFKNNGIRIKTKEILISNTEDFVVIMCKVKKKDLLIFLKCMEELERKIMITNHPHYLETCEKMQQLFE